MISKIWRDAFSHDRILEQNSLNLRRFQSVSSQLFRETKTK